MYPYGVPLILQPLLISKCDPRAIIPSRGSDNSAGLDLYACHTFTVTSMKRALIRTGLIIHSMPPFTYGRIAPRSGLALKHGVDILAGVIDNDYRGEIGVLLINFGYDDYTITTGDRIAQLIIENYSPCRVQELTPEQIKAFETQRGSGGFGSTGV